MSQHHTISPFSFSVFRSLFGKQRLIKHSGEKGFYLSCLPVLTTGRQKPGLSALTQCKPGFLSSHLHTHFSNNQPKKGPLLADTFVDHVKSLQRVVCGYRHRSVSPQVESGDTGSIAYIGKASAPVKQREHGSSPCATPNPETDPSVSINRAMSQVGSRVFFLLSGRSIAGCIAGCIATCEWRLSYYNLVAYLVSGQDRLPVALPLTLPLTIGLHGKETPFTPSPRTNRKTEKLEQYLRSDHIP